MKSNAILGHRALNMRRVCVELKWNSGPGATFSHSNNVVTPTKVKVELGCDNKYKLNYYLFIFQAVQPVGL